MIASPLLWKVGCINAAISIIIASIGGHKPWDEDRKRIFSKSNNLQLFSSIGIILSSFKGANLVSLMFLGGCLLFSCTAYYRCFTDDKSYNRLMPLGGILFISAWTLLAFS